MNQEVLVVRDAIVLNPNDNVAVALRNLRAGELVKLSLNPPVIVKLINDIPFGHKFAVRDIPKCGLVIKYGHVIGRAKEDIKVGEHVHVHNVESLTSVHSVCRGGSSGQ